MGGRGTFLRVGLLIVFGFAAVLGLILFLSGDRFRRGQTFETYFTESIQGLEVGAPIKFRGVSLGRVTKTGLVSAEYGRNAGQEINADDYRLVFVRFTIEADRVGRMPDSESAARSGLRARVASQGITGLSYIELDFLRPDALENFPEIPARPLPWTPVGEYIPSVPSTLTQVQDAATQLLAKLNKMDLEHVQEAVIGLLEDLRRSLNTGDIHTMLARANSLLGSLEQSIASGEVHDVITRAKSLLATLETTVQDANVPGLTSDLRETSGSVRAVIEGKDLRALLSNAALAAERMAQAASKLQPVIVALEATARRAGAGTADLQQALGPLLRDAQAAASNLRETTEALRQYPAGAILGGPPPRERSR